MKKITILTLTFVLLLSSLALADVSLTTNDNYAAQTQVTFSGTCSAPFVPVAFQVSGAAEPWVDQASADASGAFSTKYTTLSQGTYTLYVTCNAESTSKSFCVGDSCSGTTGGTNPGSGSPSSSSGGGGYCQAEYSCGTWSFCGANLNQSRICYDQSNCKKEPKTEVRECLPCEESWICSEWSSCYNSVQKRTCVDEHYCTTKTYQPSAQKACSATVAAGPAPKSISNDIPPPSFDQFSSQPDVEQPAPVASKFSFQNIWDDYMVWILSGVGGLIILVIVILLILHFVRAKPVVFNHDELQDWIKKERSMGTSDDDIREILADHTGWKEEEVQKAFSDLGSKPTSGQQPPATPPQGPPAQ